jgi:uncharacterized protein YoxC
MMINMTEKLSDDFQRWLDELDDSVEQWEEMHDELMPKLKALEDDVAKKLEMTQHLMMRVGVLEAVVKTLTKRVERQDQLLNPTLETRVDIHGLEEQISELKARLAKAQKLVAEWRKYADDMAEWSPDGKPALNCADELEKALGGDE